MKEIVKQLLAHKEKTLPILSFPSVSLLGITVKELISSPEMQAKGMRAITQSCPMGAALNMMDLSVEAEAFGARIRVSEDEIPAVEQGVIDAIAQAADLEIPLVGAGRTGIYLEGVRRAKQLIPELPVFCGVIGPYSLAGRLFDMTELMMECYDSPDEVELLVSKATEFLIRYIRAFQDAGADGVILAEPAAGLLSPALADQFSTPFVQEMIEKTQRENFVFCYHNCGNAVGDMLPSIAGLSADIFHFGNAVDLQKAAEAIPTDRLVMGNVDPVLFKTGTPQEIRAEVERVFTACGGYPHVMISTGCDVPAAAKWENIREYFCAVGDCYADR